MHTLTFPRTPGLAKASWRIAFSLFAFFISLSSARVAFAQQPSFYDESVTFDRQPTGGTQNTVSYAGAAYPGDTPYTTYVKLGTTSTTPATPVPSIGVFDINTPRTSQLSFTAASIVADPPRAKNGSPLGAIVAARIVYRVYLNGNSTLPDYTSVNLSDAGAFTTGGELYNVSGNLDLLQGLLSGGTYTVEVRYELDVRGNGSTTVTTYTDPSSSYQANFTVTSPPITPAGGVTTWQSTTSTAWFLASNWSNGVPTATSDAVIPENTAGTNIIFPVLNSLNRSYRVRNLTLNGTTNSGRAQITIQQAVLRVYGNIQQLSGGLVGTSIGNPGVLDSTQNSRLVMLGGDQFITGRLSVPDIIVSGTGIKSVANEMRPTNILAFVPTTSNGVIVQSASAAQNPNGTTSYVFDTTGNSTINFITTGAISTEVIGRETNVSYIKGIATAARPLQVDANGAGITETFGNLGLDLTPNHTATLVTVQRIIGDPLIGPTTPAPGATPVPIKRQYSISGDDNSASTAFASSANAVVFHYLDSVYELNTIAENNLTMFRTPTGAAPYTPLGGLLDEAANTVSLTSLASLPNYYLTLGDKTNPLPVSLTAFTAIRNGGNTLLSWTTASEQNNTGFEVQVSTDGANFRKLAFVATQDANSSRKLIYAYTDTEIGKTGVRYYRLRQIDTDEKDSFSPVRAVSFSGATSGATALSGYPNPFTNKLDFNLDATAVGNGVAHIQLVDMTGRIVREQDLKVANASLTLTDLDGLRSGLYLAKVTLPDGSTQKVRVQKQ